MKEELRVMELRRQLRQSGCDTFKFVSEMLTSMLGAPTGSAVLYGLRNCLDRVELGDIGEMQQLAGDDRLVESAELQKQPKTLYEIADWHARWIQAGGSRETGFLILFFQCTELNLMPLILHEKNVQRYEATRLCPRRLMMLLHEEQQQFYREIRPVLRQEEGVLWNIL